MRRLAAADDPAGGSLHRHPPAAERQVDRAPPHGHVQQDPDSVRLFQIHQRADYSIVVRVVLGAGDASTRHVEAAVEGLRQRIGHEVPITTEYVDRLPFTGGKVKYVLSDLTPSTAPGVPTAAG